MSNAAVEAIKFAVSTDSGIEFLQCWLHGDFGAIRREWPEAPAGVFVGAEQTFDGGSGTNELPPE